MPIIKTQHQIAAIRESGKYLNELLLKLSTVAQPGVSLIELEFVAEDYIKKHHVKWAFKNYNGFPANLCLSVNDCVVHGIPNAYVLKSGDLLKIDSWIIYQWGITDSAISLVMGGEFANPLAYDLVKATKLGLDIAIQEIWPNKPLVNYSHSIANYIHNAWFSIIEKLTGHGVGVQVHEDPHIYNFPHPSMKKTFFKPGMVVAIEPITAVTSTDFMMKKGNDWDLFCKNGDLGAHWEYTILITNNGYEILSGITENLWF